MKTSNKIFISFLIFLSVGIVSLYIGSKYYKYYYDDAANFADQKTVLSSFSVVVAEPDAIFYLKSGKQNEIIQKYRKESVPNFAPFVVRNDTLFISSVEQYQTKGGYDRIIPEVFCVNVKSIMTKENSNVRMEKFQIDSLDITMNKSRLDWRFENVAYLSIQAKDSDINLDGENLEKLMIQMDKTELRAASKKGLNSFSGSIKNNSYIDFPINGKMNIDIDKSSRLYLD